MLQAVFTKSVDKIEVPGLTQWDRGQELEVTIPDLPESLEAHFSYKGAGTAYVVEATGTDGTAVIPIPNIICTQNRDAVCWIYYTDGDSGETVKTIYLPIEAREKPSDYVYTESDVLSYKSLEERIKALEKGGASDDAIASAVAKWLEENPIESGTSDAVQYIAQTLTEEQKTQARTNIGAASAKEVSQLSATVNDKVTNPTTGKAGQIIAILTVDENGKPTSYQAIDKPSGAEISTEELQEAVNNYLEKNPVSGLSVKEKETLLALFKSIEYTGDMSATIKRLEALFAGEEGISYTITYNLTNVTSSDSETTIVEGSAKTITLTADEGFLLDTVTVTMSGEDITSSVYADGVITITSATGNIVITANAVNADILAPVYLLENTTFDGATTIDTGYKLFDTEKSFTITMDFDVDTCQNANLFHEYNEAVNMNCGIYMNNGWYAQIKGYFADNLLANIAQGNNAQNIKAIITHEVNTLNYTAIYISDGEMVKVTDTGTQNYHSNIIGKTGNLIVGGRFDTDGTLNYFTGKVNTFAVYERILEESEIVEFMEV